MDWVWNHNHDHETKDFRFEVLDYLVVGRFRGAPYFGTRSLDRLVSFLE